MASSRSLWRLEAWLCVLALGCGAEASNTAKAPAYPDEYISDCRITSESSAFASDENYVVFVEAEAAGRLKIDACQAPELLSPSPGATLDPNAPPEFAFRATAITCALHRMPALQGCPPPSPLWERMLEAALMERVAQAHCGAFTGENYLLRLRRDGETLYTALLSTTSFVPSAAKWSAALSPHRGAQVELTVERAVYVTGRITEGPFATGKPMTFTVPP